MNKSKIFGLLLIVVIGVAAWLVMGNVAIDVIQESRKVDSTSVSLDSTDIRYIWTDDYQLRNGSIVINGSKYRYESNGSVIHEGVKELFQISGSTARIYAGETHVTGLKDFLELRGKLNVKDSRDREYSLIIPEGFEGIYRLNNSILTVGNVAIEGKGGGWAWFLFVVCIVVFIGLFPYFDDGCYTFTDIFVEPKFDAISTIIAMIVTVIAAISLWNVIH